MKHTWGIWPMPDYQIVCSITVLFLNTQFKRGNIVRNNSLKNKICYIVYYLP